MTPSPIFDLSALVLLVPEIDDIIGFYRKRYTRDGAIGMPCHITILYPFVDAGAWHDGMLDHLSGVASLVDPISLGFKGLACFEEKDVLFLEPYPQDDILKAIRQVANQFPLYPPYEGAFPLSELRPHLTVATGQPEATFEQIKHDLLKDIKNISNYSAKIN